MKIEKYGIPMYNLKRASGSTQDGRTVAVFYDIEAGWIFTREHTGAKWTGRDGFKMRVLNVSRHVTMQEISDAIRHHMTMGDPDVRDAISLAPYAHPLLCPSCDLVGTFYGGVGPDGFAVRVPVWRVKETGSCFYHDDGNSVKLCQAHNMATARRLFLRYKADDAPLLAPWEWGAC